MMYVIDTNAIIYAIKQKISLEKFLFEEIVVPSSVVEELEKLSINDKNAKIALRLIQKYKVIETSEKGDEGIIDVALRNNGKVITNDADLIKRLKLLGISAVSVSLGMVRS
ncbi:MAG: PIN domain-containing protein [Thermoplasmatales archaeon]